jgi:uncharacterized membrane protein
VQSPLLLPTGFDTNFQMLLRWVHLLSGITWIGLLYFFNLVSVPLLPTLDPPVRGKLVTLLLPRALWWFRWAAIVTVAAGGTYWVIILLREDAPLVRTLLLWAVLIYAAFKLQMLLLRLPPLTNNPTAFVIAALLLVGLQGHAMTRWLVYPGMSHRALAIAVGGGIGVFLLHNVLEVVWPTQRRFIAWCGENPGQAPPPELALALRRAQLVARASFWLSFPMLFFMAAASHLPFFAAPSR